MKKPVVVQACQSFAMQVFPVVAEVICLIVSPIIILGYWFDYAIRDFKTREEGRLWDSE